MSEEERIGRSESTSIEWSRPYDIGPSDHHLHAIGQFIAIYSNIEWQLFGLFAFYLKRPAPLAQELVADANISMTGIIRTVEKHVSQSVVDPQATADMLATMKSFEAISKLRHKVVHWQWSLGDEEEAELSDYIRAKKANPSVTISLEQLRAASLTLVRILQAVIHNSAILMEQASRADILRVRKDTSPERLLRP